MTPRLKVKNENQNRLELLNKRRKLARAADILDGKDFQIYSISFPNSLEIFLVISLWKK